MGVVMLGAAAGEMKQRHPVIHLALSLSIYLHIYIYILGSTHCVILWILSGCYCLCYWNLNCKYLHRARAHTRARTHARAPAHAHALTALPPGLTRVAWRLKALPPCPTTGLPARLRAWRLTAGRDDAPAPLYHRRRWPQTPSKRVLHRRKERTGWTTRPPTRSRWQILALLASLVWVANLRGLTPKRAPHSSHSRGIPTSCPASCTIASTTSRERKGPRTEWLACPEPQCPHVDIRRWHWHDHSSRVVARTPNFHF